MISGFRCRGRAMLRSLCVAGAALGWSMLLPVSSPAATVTGIRASTSDARTRIVLDLDRNTQFTHRTLPTPPRIIVELDDAAFADGVETRAIPGGYVKRVRTNALRSGKVQAVLDLTRVLDYTIFTLQNPPRIVVDVKHAGAPEGEPAPARDTAENDAGAAAKKDAPRKDTPAGDTAAGKEAPKTDTAAGKEAPKTDTAAKKEAPKTDTAAGQDAASKRDTASGETSASKETPKDAASAKNTASGQGALPAKDTAPKKTETPAAKRPPVRIDPPTRDTWVVAIDAGHGGDDTGARHFRTNEKDITLDLARSLKEELEKIPGIQPILVRKGDYYIPLRRRWTLAEKQGADLFVSLHCNASQDKDAAGTEVYFLSLKGATDEAAVELAKAENAVDAKMGIETPEAGLDAIIFDMQQTDVLAKSQMLAESCLEHLYDLGTVYGRGVKQAGFAVLKSPRMPSILVEAAFLSHRDEVKLLRDPDWREDFGKHLAEGIAAYVHNVQPTAKASLEKR